MANNCYPFENLPLPYGCATWSRTSTRSTMEAHYQHHLQAYIDSLNQLLSGRPTLQAYPLERLAAGTLRLPPASAHPVAPRGGRGVQSPVLLLPPAKSRSGGAVWELAEAIGRCLQHLTSSRPRSALLPCRCLAPATPGWCGDGRGCAL